MAVPRARSAPPARPHRPGRVHHLAWLWVLLIGAVVWIIGAGVTAVTDDDILVPTLILTGSFLVPVSMVMFALTREGEDQLPEDVLHPRLRDRRDGRRRDRRLRRDYLLPTATGTFIMVGVIEELTKARHRRGRRQPDLDPTPAGRDGARCHCRRRFRRVRERRIRVQRAHAPPGRPSGDQRPADRDLPGCPRAVRPHHLDGTFRRCPVRGRAIGREIPGHLAACRRRSSA